MMVSITTTATSFAQAKGWQAITAAVNQNINYGLFTTDGTPFYKSPTDGGSATTSNATTSTSFGDKVVNVISGSLDTFTKALSPDTTVEAGVVSFNYTKTTEITNAPLEQGQFLSYNKVRVPTQIQINYVTTGTEKQRKYFENALEKSRLSFALFTFYTGELSIPNVNITGFSISREPNSQQMYNVSITVQEVMIQAKTNITSDATAFSGSGQDIGELQTTTATGSQTQSAKKAA